MIIRNIRSVYTLYISLHNHALSALIQQNGLTDMTASKTCHGSKKSLSLRLIFLTPMTGFAVKYNHFVQKVVLTILSFIYTHKHADFQYDTFISAECRQNIKILLAQTYAPLYDHAYVCYLLYRLTTSSTISAGTNGLMSVLFATKSLIIVELTGNIVAFMTLTPTGRLSAFIAYPGRGYINNL